MYCNSMSYKDIADICELAADVRQTRADVVFVVANDDIEYKIEDATVSTEAYTRWMYDEFLKRTGLKDSEVVINYVSGTKELVPENLKSVMYADVVIFERPWSHNPALRLFMTACNIYRIPYAVI